MRTLVSFIYSSIDTVMNCMYSPFASISEYSFFSKLETHESVHFEQSSCKRTNLAERKQSDSRQ